MCGILGFVNSNFSSNKSWLISNSKYISHRGPDNKGFWYSKDEKVGFSHLRLSILDLSQDSNQPMYFEELGLTITFNGEIYNYLQIKSELSALGYNFKTKSDTEVILISYYHWGPDCFKRLIGMFAIAIYDLKQNILILARDRVGEKPLFYGLINNDFLFSSELTPFLNRNDKKIDIESLDFYLTFGYLPSTKSMLKDVYKVNPGSYLKFNINKNLLSENIYWNIPQYNNANIGIDDSLNHIMSLLEESIKLQMKADVPVGILLSGGLDSSVITAIASKESSNIKTFSFGFKDNLNLNELKFSKEISNYFGTDHIELEVNKIDYDTLLYISNNLDEPIGDSSIIPTYLISKLVSKYCKVAIGGDGADEIFGGYPHYQTLLSNRNRYRYIPNYLKKIIENIFISSIRDGLKGKNYLRNLIIDYDTSLPFAPNIFSTKTRKNLLRKCVSYIPSAEQQWCIRVPKNEDIIERALRMDTINYLPGDILSKVDRASMLNSLEVRSPYLDYRIIDHVFSSIPSSLKVDMNNRKILLKKIGKKVLPNYFDFNRKQGFSIPLGNILKKGKICEMMLDELTDKNCLFDKKTITQLFNDQKIGFSNSERIYNIYQFEMWRKKFSLSI